MYQKLIWGEPARHFDHSNDQLFEQDEYRFKFSRFNSFLLLTVYCLVRFFLIDYSLINSDNRDSTVDASILF